MRGQDLITDAINMNLDKLWEMVGDREAWRATVHGVAKSWTWLGNLTTTSESFPVTQSRRGVLFCGSHTVRYIPKTEVSELQWGMTFSESSLLVLFTVLSRTQMCHKIEARTIFMWQRVYSKIHTLLQLSILFIHQVHHAWFLLCTKWSLNASTCRFPLGHSPELQICQGIYQNCMYVCVCVCIYIYTHTRYKYAKENMWKLVSWILALHLLYNLGQVTWRFERNYRNKHPEWNTVCCEFHHSEA